MEFPKLQMQTQKKLDELEQSPDRIRKNIEEALRILEGHDNAAEKKQEAYEKYQLMVDADPEAAKAYWDKKKLAVTWKRVAEKFQSLIDSSKELKGIPVLRKELEKEMDTVLQFHPMQDQADNPVTQAHFRKAEPEEWGDRRNLNSIHKLAQDIFTPPNKRRVPEEKGRYGNTPHDDIPLEFCVFDPRLIPIKFLERFKMAEKFTKDMTPYQKMERRAKAIPNVKLFFEHLRPIRKGNYRFLVLRDYSPEFDGTIIHSHYLGMLPKSVDRKIIQGFDSAYAASRKTEHEERGHTDELSKVTAVEIRIMAINKQVGRIRAKDPDREIKEEDACEKLASEISQLQHITNYHKRSARAVLERIADLKDSLGRKNLAATCARLLTVLKHIQERPEQIFGKSKYTTEDRHTLTMHISKGETTLEECFKGFENVCHELSNAKGSRRKGKQEELLGFRNGYLSRVIFRHLGSLPDLSELHVRPFSLYARKLHKKRNAIAEAVQASDYKAVCDESVKAFVVCKIFEVQKALERVLRDISLLPFETHVGVLLEKAQRLNETVKAREVFSDIEVESYKAVYSELEKKTGDLVRGLEHYENNSLSAKKRQVMYKRLKKYLEDIDFPEILAKLD